MQTAIINQSDPNLVIFDDHEQVARAAADRLVELAGTAIEANGQFCVALSGGSTPERIYQWLAGDHYRNKIRWDSVHVFFGDERCVPADDKDSNYRMANEALLSRVAIPSVNVHRVEGQGDAAANARRYESQLKEFFGNVDWPRFDLVMLGMGNDGHTASLFPQSTALAEQSAWVVANWVEKFNTFRITLTAPVINHAAHVMFIIAGAEKADILREVLHGHYDPSRLPSQLVNPINGSLEWFLDKAAAGLS